MNTAPGVCVCVCVRASTAPGVCALGWVKCREQHFTAGYTFFFTKPITDYGKMLKYREKYR